MIKSYLWVSRLILSVLLCSLMTCLQGKTVFFIFQRIKVISPGRPLVDKKKNTNERSSRLHNAT